MYVCMYVCMYVMRLLLDALYLGRQPFKGSSTTPRPGRLGFILYSVITYNCPQLRKIIFITYNCPQLRTIVDNVMRLFFYFPKLRYIKTRRRYILLYVAISRVGKK